MSQKGPKRFGKKKLRQNDATTLIPVEIVAHRYVLRVKMPPRLNHKSQIHKEDRPDLISGQGSHEFWGVSNLAEKIQVTDTPSGAPDVGLPRARLVPVDQPWKWLNLGWNDVLRKPAVSLSYGALLVILSYALVYALLEADFYHIILPLTGGFFIMAPLLAVGLYETSRLLEKGQPVSLFIALTAWRRPGQLFYMGIVLLIIHLIWIRVALLLYALFFSGMNPNLETLINTLLNSDLALPFLITGTIFGGVFAVITFALSAVAIPMLLDRDVNVVGAMFSSARCVLRNYRAMALWAALIVVFTAAGLATLFFGLVIAMPLVAHATWHAYRDLYPAADDD